MAIACLRLVTLRPDPLLSVPRFRRRIADATFFDAALLYFAMSSLGKRSAVRADPALRACYGTTGLAGQEPAASLIDATSNSDRFTRSRPMTLSVVVVTVAAVGPRESPASASI